MKLNNFHFI